MARQHPRGHEPVTAAQRTAEERVDSLADDVRAHRSWPRRHLSFMALLSIALVCVIGLGGYVYSLARSLDDIPRVPMGVSSASAAKHGGGTDILVMATNSHTSDVTVSDVLRDGDWEPGSLPGAGFFWIHLPERGTSASVVSIPAAMWTSIRGYPHHDGQGRLRDAFTYGGPTLALHTVEDVTGVQFDHAAVFDWQGLAPLTEAVDGIRVYVPERLRTDNTSTTWDEGLNYIKGGRVITYQVSGESLPQYLTAGIDRAVWQQNLLRALTDKLFIPSTSGNPLRLSGILSSLREYVTVDSTWTHGDLRSTVLRSRTIAAGSVTLASLPLTGPYLHASSDSPPALSVDREHAEAMIDAVQRNKLGRFLSRNPQLSTRGITATD